MENIKKVEVFKHEPTGQLFERFEDYEKCKNKYEEREAKRQEDSRIAKKWNKYINEPRLTATSIDDFIKKVENLLNDFYKDRAVIQINFTGVKFENAIYANHSKPIGYPSYDPNDPQNSDKNWIRNYLRYPGWEGTISGTVKHLTSDKSASGTYLNKPGKGPWDEKIPGLCTSSGSGGERFRYSATVFLYDLPLVHNQFKEAFDKKDELEKSIVQRKDEQQKYIYRREKFYEDNVTVKGVRKELDDTILKIQKLTEAKKLYESSLQSYKAGLFEEYAGKEPWDFSIVDTLVQQLNLVKKDIKL